MYQAQLLFEVAPELRLVVAAMAYTTIRSGGTMSSRTSSRAAILKQLLPYLNTRRYTEWGEYIVFGASSAGEFMERVTSLPSSDEDQPMWDALADAAHSFKVHEGTQEMGERVTLGESASKLSFDAIDRLSPEHKKRLFALIEKVLPLYQASNKATGVSRRESADDSIDAALTEEFIGKLPAAVDRAVRLDHIGVERVPANDLRRYFEEANRCYLYGFNVACAVLCRAILESALKTVCDPKGSIKRLTSNSDKGYFKELVESAKDRGFLTEYGPSWALNVRDAGNDAIHGYAEFERCWGNKIEKVLDQTRRVLIDLFRIQKLSKTGKPTSH
jgi:hypothetical protein